MVKKVGLLSFLQVGHNKGSSDIEDRVWQRYCQYNREIINNGKLYKQMTNKIVTIASLAIIFCSCNDTSKSQQVNNKKDDLEILSEAYEKGNWDLIISIGDTLIGEDDPKNISILYAEALAAKGKIEKAINVLNKKIANKPDDYYLFQTKGNIFYIEDAYDSAIVSYDKVIEMRPTYARPYVYEGEIYTIIGEKQKAITRYMEAVRLFADNGFIDEVQELCNRVLSIDSTNVEAKGYLEQAQVSQE